MISEKLLRRVVREVRMAHPEVIGAGIGLRRKSGRIKREFVLKLYVAKKLKKGKGQKFKMLPKHWPLTIGKGQKQIHLKLPTDVESPMLVSATSFDVGPVQSTCWIRWQDRQNQNHVGVVTAGHGLPAPGQLVPVQGLAQPGVVVARSNYESNGLDVGLVEVRDGGGALDAGPRNAIVAPANVIINMIGTDASDNLAVQAELWFGDLTPNIRALAYMVEHPIQYPDGRVFILKDVLIADGEVGAFDRGVSGSTWATIDPGPTGYALALQCFGRSPDFDVGIGTHLGSAINWLAKQPGIKPLNCWWVIP